MRTIKLSLTIAACATMILSACGGDRPSIDDVKQNFESPTGSSTDKSAVVSTNEKRTGSAPAHRIAGNGGGFGFGLTAHGKQRGLERLQAPRMFNREFQRVKYFLEGKQQQALSAAQSSADPCVDDDAVEGALKSLFAEILLTGSGSGSFKYDVDANKCSEGELTGTMTVKGKIEASKDSFKFSIEQTLTDVCEVGGEKACVTGEFLIEMEAKSENGGELGNASFVTAWFATASWDDDGTPVTAEAKGGVRIMADNTSASLEYLYYVKDKDGNEVTYVLRITANADGSGTLEIRCADSEISCTVAADGSGMCTAKDDSSKVVVEWTDAEAGAIAADESLMKY